MSAVLHLLSAPRLQSLWSQESGIPQSSRVAGPSSSALQLGGSYLPGFLGGFWCVFLLFDVLVFLFGESAGNPRSLGNMEVLIRVFSGRSLLNSTCLFFLFASSTLLVINGTVSP